MNPGPSHSDLANHSGPSNLDSADPMPCPTHKVVHPCRPKPKPKSIHIIGSSIARNLSRPTSHALERIGVDRVCTPIVQTDSYPSAGTGQILSLKAEKADHTVIICGGNDVEQGVKMEKIAENVACLIDNHQAVGSEVSFCSILRPARRNTKLDNNITSANKILREVVRSAGATWIDLELRPGFAPYGDYRDQRHPSTIGQKRMAKLIASGLEKGLLQPNA